MIVQCISNNTKTKLHSHESGPNKSSPELQIKEEIEVVERAVGVVVVGVVVVYYCCYCD